MRSRWADETFGFGTSAPTTLRASDLAEARYSLIAT